MAQPRAKVPLTVQYYLDHEKNAVKQNEEDLRRNVGDGRKYIAHAIYVCVSLRAMQAIDFGYLVEKGFKFHHYRAPGHGDTPRAEPRYTFVTLVSFDDLTISELSACSVVVYLLVRFTASS